MKTKGELCALKEEVEALSKKLAELNEEELAQVTGGGCSPLIIGNDSPMSGLDGINSDDIESIDVLKDAASAAFYGSRTTN